IPAKKLLPAGFKLAVTVVPAPAANVPLPEEMLSQAGTLATLQFNVAAPKFVKKNFCALTLNGPPTGPFATKPKSGEMASISGMASALIKLIPFGVPQPVQRS